MPRFLDALVQGSVPRGPGCSQYPSHLSRRPSGRERNFLVEVWGPVLGHLFWEGPGGALGIVARRVLPSLGRQCFLIKSAPSSFCFLYCFFAFSFHYPLLFVFHHQRETSSFFLPTRHCFVFVLIFIVVCGAGVEAGCYARQPLTLAPSLYLGFNLIFYQFRATD